MDPLHEKWKEPEFIKQRTVYQIDRIDNFNGHSASMPSEYFGKFIVDLDERKSGMRKLTKYTKPTQSTILTLLILPWDSADTATRLGIGYAQTKVALGITREQLFLYGLQDFADGSCLLWGTEVDEKYNHLMLRVDAILALGPICSLLP